MDAASRETSSRRRRLCLLAGVLCALGIVCATAVPASAGTPHHRPHTSAVAVAVLADGHGTSVRTADDAVAASTATTLSATRSTTVASPGDRAEGVASVETVRTRGPPALR